MAHLPTLPRPEYPRPDFVRTEWINLNGQWQFEIDHGKSGKERGYHDKGHDLSGTITVPFCPESKLSGVEYTDFMAAVWYKRELTLPENWTNGRTLLHFGAVDYMAEVWVNGVSVGTHRGGYTSFSFDITSNLLPGGNVISVYAEDDVRSGASRGANKVKCSTRMAATTHVLRGSGRQFGLSRCPTFICRT